MIKLLMFEEDNLAAIYYDLVANYDRIRASISNLMTQRHMVDKNILRARAMVLERMCRHVKTGLGMSKKTCGNEKDDKDKVEGQVQGKADVPPLWCAQSDTLLRAHSRQAFGMCIYNPKRQGGLSGATLNLSTTAMDGPTHHRTLLIKSPPQWRD